MESSLKFGHSCAATFCMPMRSSACNKPFRYTVTTLPGWRSSSIFNAESNINVFPLPRLPTMSTELFWPPDTVSSSMFNKWSRCAFKFAAKSNPSAETGRSRLTPNNRRRKMRMTASPPRAHGTSGSSTFGAMAKSRRDGASHNSAESSTCVPPA